METLGEALPGRDSVSEIAKLTGFDRGFSTRYGGHGGGDGSTANGGNK